MLLWCSRKLINKNRKRSFHLPTVLVQQRNCSHRRFRIFSAGNILFQAAQECSTEEQIMLLDLHFNLPFGNTELPNVILMVPKSIIIILMHITNYHCPLFAKVKEDIFYAYARMNVGNSVLVYPCSDIASLQRNLFSKVDVLWMITANHQLKICPYRLIGVPHAGLQHTGSSRGVPRRC